MASEKFNTLTGISVGIPPVNVVDSTGNVVSNFNNLTGNVSANRVFANSYFYANGEPFNGSSGNGVPGGGNATLQFNNGGNFAGTINLTYNTNSNTINVPNLLATGAVELGSIANIRITGGSDNQVLTTDGLGNLRWQTAPGTGNGSPGGSNTFVQFNNQGTFGGSSGLRFDTNSSTLIATIIEASDINATSIDANSIQVVNSIGAANVNAVNANLTGNLRVINGLVNFTGVANITLGVVSNVKITGGTNGQVLTTDGNGNLSWQEMETGGNAVPGGSNTQIQFNNSGFFEGSSAFTFNNSTNTVQVTGNLIANTFQMGSGIYKFSNSEVYFASTTSTASGQVLYSVPVASISGVEFHIIATNQAANTRQSSKISSVTYREQVQFVEYAGLEIGGGVGTFNVQYNPGNLIVEPSLELRVTPLQATQTIYKMLVTVFSQ